MIAPLVHLNGTAASVLVEQHAAIVAALRASLEALRAGAPNARDFYPQGEDAIRQARKEHAARVEAVTNVLAEVEAILDNVVEQMEHP